jgi:hypothetical protein
MKHRISTVVALVSLCALVGGVQIGHAHTARTITGTITDQYGAVVPSAGVVITNSSTDVVTRTLKAGASTSFRRDNHSAYRSIPAPLDNEKKSFFGQLEETRSTSGGRGENCRRDREYLL